MKGLIAFLIAMAATVALAQTSAPGPYYATPSWDQKLQCDTQATCPRFIVLSNWNNDAVLDRETGLVWERSPSSSAFIWENAQAHCNNLAVGNRRGWRVATVQELSSLMDSTVASPPALPAGHPFSNISTAFFYWAANTWAFDTSHAWTVDFVTGGAQSFASKSDSGILVWCVRGGQGIDLQ